MIAELINGILAVLLGLGATVLLFLPVTAREYRRDGHLGLGTLLLLLSGAIYTWALVTYTLLPLPDRNAVVCRSAQLHPLQSITDTSSSTAVLQVALNVLLFLPLGAYLRLLGRGVVQAGLVGLGVSLLIELTQLTGIWGIYRCAYRVFDVDDLLVNTAGAVLGSLVAAPLVHLVRTRPTQVLPTRITLGRRLVGMTGDVLFVLVTAVILAVAWRAWEVFGLGRHGLSGTSPMELALQWGVPWLLEAALVLFSGRTVGELAIAVRTRASPDRSVVLARAVKLLTGISVLVALLTFSFPYDTWVLLAFALLSVATAAGTPDRRGLTGLLSGLALEIDRRDGWSSSHPPVSTGRSGSATHSLQEPG